MNEEEIPMTVEELDNADRYLEQQGVFAATHDNHNVHLFLHNIAIAEDTTKLGFLKEEELGMPTHPMRLSKDLALIGEKIMDIDYFKEFFIAEAENTTSTSLSRDGFLVKQATTTTKRLADMTDSYKRPRSKGGLFKKKEEEQPIQV